MVGAAPKHGSSGSSSMGHGIVVSGDVPYRARPRGGTDAGRALWWYGGASRLTAVSRGVQPGNKGIGDGDSISDLCDLDDCLGCDPRAA
jgi:hypothetical protein